MSKKRSKKKGPIIRSNKPIYKGIQFQSTLEVNCYKKLETSGLTFSYEAESFLLWKGLTIKNLPFYKSKKGVKLLVTTKTGNYKLADITYKPDFRVDYKNYVIFVESKGHATEPYNIRRKMFLQSLSERNDKFKYLFFEPRNQGQMDQVIEIIKAL